MRASETLSWQAHARCRPPADSNLWDGVPTSESHYASRDFSEARKVCAQCPVSQICLEAALENRDTGCMRGGKDPGELKELLQDRIQTRRKRRPVRKPRRELVAA